MTIRVAVRYPVPGHRFLRTIMENPPSGYSYSPEPVRGLASKPLEALIGPVYSRLWDRTSRAPVLKDMWLLARQRFFPAPPRENISLVLVLTDQIGLSKIPVILFPGVATASSLPYRVRMVRPDVRKILATSPTEAQTYRSILSEKEWERLVGVLRTAIPLPPPFVKTKRGEVTLLFVGSANFPNDANYHDRTFYFRGGTDVLCAFRIINRIYQERVRLILRTKIPDPVKSAFKDVLGLPNVRVIEGILPASDLHTLYSSSDVLLVPGFGGVWLTILDAFSYAIPVVTTDTYDSLDYVQDGFNGRVVHRDSSGKFYLRNFVPVWDDNAIARDSLDPAFAIALAKTISELVEDESDRISLGRNGRQLVESGEFSLPAMKRQLATYFEEVLSVVT